MNACVCVLLLGWQLIDLKIELRKEEKKVRTEKVWRTQVNYAIKEMWHSLWRMKGEAKKADQEKIDRNDKNTFNCVERIYFLFKYRDNFLDTVILCLMLVGSHTLDTQHTTHNHANHVCTNFQFNFFVMKSFHLIICRKFVTRV